jgi:hypothetical protein
MEKMTITLDNNRHIRRLRLRNGKTLGLLLMVQRLTMAYKEDVLDAALMPLVSAAIPGVEHYHVAVDSGDAPDMLKALAALEALVASKREAMTEALQLGYLLGLAWPRLKGHLPEAKAGNPFPVPRGQTGYRTIGAEATYGRESRICDTPCGNRASRRSSGRLIWISERAGLPCPPANRPLSKTDRKRQGLHPPAT